jgi:hypothetical protein
MEELTKEELESGLEAVKATEKKQPKAAIKQTPVAAISRNLIDIINGNFLTKEHSLKQAPFIFFLSLMAMLYISNSYYAEKKIREINKVNNELKELRSEYITSKSKLMFITKQSEVAKAAEKMGLSIRESIVPPGKIIIE